MPPGKLAGKQTDADRCINFTIAPVIPTGSNMELPPAGVRRARQARNDRCRMPDCPFIAAGVLIKSIVLRATSGLLIA